MQAAESDIQDHAWSPRIVNKAKSKSVHKGFVSGIRFFFALIGLVVLTARHPVKIPETGSLDYRVIPFM